MDIHQIFQRLILRKVESNIQKCNTGRPKEINKALDASQIGITYLRVCEVVLHRSLSKDTFDKILRSSSDAFNKYSMLFFVMVLKNKQCRAENVELQILRLTRSDYKRNGNVLRRCRSWPNVIALCLCRCRGRRWSVRNGPLGH